MPRQWRGMRCAADFFPVADRGGTADQPVPALDVSGSGIRTAEARTYADVNRNRTLQAAAALSYYFVMSLLPAALAAAEVPGNIVLPAESTLTFKLLKPVEVKVSS